MVTSSGWRLQILNAGKGACGHGRGKGIREELRPGALGEIVTNLGRSRGETAGGAAQRFPQSGRDDVDLTDQVEMLGGAAPMATEDPGRMGIIHHENGVCCDGRHPGDRAGGDDPSIEKMPSVITSLILRSLAAASLASRS